MSYVIHWNKRLHVVPSYFHNLILQPRECRSHLSSKPRYAQQTHQSPISPTSETHPIALESWKEPRNHQSAHPLYVCWQPKAENASQMKPPCASEERPSWRPVPKWYSKTTESHRSEITMSRAFRMAWEKWQPHAASPNHRSIRRCRLLESVKQN